MKKNVSVLMMVILLVVVPFDLCRADCTSDCRIALEAADKLIKDLKEQVNTYDSLSKEQQKSIIELSNQNKEKGEQLSSPIRNPYLVGSIGITVGIVLTLLLKK